MFETYVKLSCPARRWRSSAMGPLRLMLRSATASLTNTCGWNSSAATTSVGPEASLSPNAEITVRHYFCQ